MTGRRDEIVDKAARLFASHGYEATTVRDIAQEVGIRPGGLYYHFASKEELVAEILTRFSAAMVAEYDLAAGRAADPADAVERMIGVAFGAIVTHRDAVAIIQRDWPHFESAAAFEHIHRETRRVERMWIEAFDRGREAGLFRTDVAPGLLYLFVRDTVWSAVRWFRPAGPLSLDEIRDAFIRVFMHGVLAARDV